MVPMLFDAVAKEARLYEFNPQELANMIWAYGRVHYIAPTLFDAVETEAVARGLGLFDPQELAMMVGAYGKAKHAAPALFDAVAAEAVARGLDKFKPHELAHILCA